MLSSTLKDYKENCNANLLAFLDQYEDNTKAFFLKNEKEKYQTYQHALCKISNQIDYYTKDEIKSDPINKVVAADLHKININAYNKIITVFNKQQEHKTDENFLSLLNLKNDRIHIDENELENHIKSSIVILKFISEEYNNSNDHNSFSFALNTVKSVSPFKEFQNSELPDLKNVFFIHYQCDNFNVSDEIKSLGIFADDKVIEFKNKSEADNIEEYCNTVNDLLERGLIPIHWSQNRPHYGIEHIISRYTKLTGKKINIEYKNSLNLSSILKHKFGEEYVNHPRLDNLALLNSFHGISTKEKGLRTFDANRVLLLYKIYFGILNKSLKIGSYYAEESTKNDEQIINIVPVIKQSSVNDFIRSTINEYLEDIIENINTEDYSILVDSLYYYFTTSKFPKLTRKIIFKKVNKKKVGWALKELYKNLKTDNLDIEYFRFAQENINLFENEVIVMENFNKSNFYKTFTSNPAK